MVSKEGISLQQQQQKKTKHNSLDQKHVNVSLF